MAAAASPPPIASAQFEDSGRGSHFALAAAQRNSRRASGISDISDISGTEDVDMGADVGRLSDLEGLGLGPTPWDEDGDEETGVS